MSAEATATEICPFKDETSALAGDHRWALVNERREPGTCPAGCQTDVHTTEQCREEGWWVQHRRCERPVGHSGDHHWTKGTRGWAWRATREQRVLVRYACGHTG